MMSTPVQLTNDDTPIIHTWGDVATDREMTTFDDSEVARFIRLVVRDSEGYLRDSHVGLQGQGRLNTKTMGIPEFNTDSEPGLLNHLQIPVDFDEWYFILASYDPLVLEDDDSFYLDANLEFISDFWRGNYTELQGYQEKTGNGAKCKIDVISKKELLRARGYAPE